MANCCLSVIARRRRKGFCLEGVPSWERFRPIPVVEGGSVRVDYILPSRAVHLGESGFRFRNSVSTFKQLDWRHPTHVDIREDT